MITPEKINGHLIWFVSERRREDGQYACSRCGFRYLDLNGVRQSRCTQEGK